MPKPETVMNIVFKTGQSLVVRSVKKKGELRGTMNEDEDTTIVLVSVERQIIKVSEQDQSIAYILGDQEISFTRGDVLFFTLQEVMPPPSIVPASAGVPVIPPPGSRPMGVM